MKNIAIIVSSLCCLTVAGCSKSNDQPGLFSSRHWHRSRITTTKCYTQDTHQLLSDGTSSADFDTVFAIQPASGGINFLGYVMPASSTRRYGILCLHAGVRLDNPWFYVELRKEGQRRFCSHRL